MTPTDEPDTRPLHEKLADHVKPVVYTVDITSGKEFKLLGNAHDIERVRKACKQAIKEFEEQGLDPDKRLAVSIPAREVTH